MRVHACEPGVQNLWWDEALVAATHCDTGHLGGRPVTQSPVRVVCSGWYTFLSTQNAVHLVLYCIGVAPYLDLATLLEYRLLRVCDVLCRRPAGVGFWCLCAIKYLIG